MTFPKRMTGARLFTCCAIVLIMCLNFWLSDMALSFNSEQSSLELLSVNNHNNYNYNNHDKNVDSTEQRLRLPTPIIVVGLPKVGTSSIHAMFTCSGHKSSHYCCCGSNKTHTDCKGGGGTNPRTFAVCIRDNLKASKPILENCGDYEVYAQLDAESGKSIYLPQHDHLEELHNYAPNATFVLNLRPAQDWVDSVTHWFGLGGRFLKRFDINVQKMDRHEALRQIFDNHTARIRDFVQSHPSHKLVEVDISTPSAGQILANEFGMDVKCWGQHNQNKKKKLAGQNG